MPKLDNNKRPKPDDPSTSPSEDVSNNELARMIAAQSKSMENQINKLGNDLRAEFTQLGNDLRTEFKEGLCGIKQEIEAVKTDVTHLKSEVVDIRQDNASSKLSNDVIISGVPFIEREDLHLYFNAWCKALGYANGTEPAVDIRRLSKVPLRDGKQCFILVQFAYPNQRNDFYAKYLRSHCLTLRHIGFQSDNRVYVNENLIPAARVIKAKALELKKEGKLTSVYSRNGVIFVKATNGDRDRPIKAVDQLQEFRN